MLYIYMQTCVHILRIKLFYNLFYSTLEIWILCFLKKAIKQNQLILEFFLLKTYL